MARTQTKGNDIGDGSVGRADLNTATTGSAVITKLVDGSLGVKISSSTGADAGTGDVVLKIDTAYLDTLYATLAGDDFTGNISAPNLIEGYTTTATAAGTTTLTVTSTYIQFFTGTTTQTVKLPVTSTLKLGHQFWIVNKSTGAVTVQSSGANSVQVIAAGSSASVTCILLTGTTAASWHAKDETAGGTVPDNAATYAKQGTEFKGDLTITSNAIDWSTGFYKAITLAANTTYTFTNLEKGKTIILKMTGSYTPTFPAAVVIVNGGTYDGTKQNYIIMTCVDSATPTVLTTINKP